MPVRSAFEYAVVRVVPDVAREEHVNAGAIVFCAAEDVIAARIELDEARLLALHPGADLPLIRAHLGAIPRICAGGPDGGPMAALPPRERFQWLVAPRDTVVQTSAPHAGMTDDPAAVLERLLATMVRTPGGRR